MTEWRAVVGYEGVYDVSDDGRVRRVSDNAGGRGEKPLDQPREIKVRLDVGGYPRVNLCRRGRAKQIFVHLLMLRAFVGPAPTPDHESAHENGVRTDNRLTNLSWKTHAENIADRMRHGNAHEGDRHRSAKLTSAKVAIIRKRLRAGEGQSALADEHGVTRATLWGIAHNKTWKRVA